MKTSELTGVALDWAVANALYGHTRPTHMYKYSTDWAKGGPIIEREGIDTVVVPCILDVPKRWAAEYIVNDKYFRMEGPTPLIAAMRCFVSSKLGDDVEIPEELK